MDFFEYSSIVSGYTNEYWVWYLVGGLCFAIVFIFEGIALFTIAGREGFKNRWMAFVPFLNTFYIGICAQKNKFYNISAKKIGIVTAVFEAVLFALFIVYNVATITILESNVPWDSAPVWYGIEERIYRVEAAGNLKWAAWMYNYMYEYILSILELIFLLLEISLLMCFFQTYASRRYVLFTITSVLFPIQGILFFTVRNNKGLNYKEFVRNEQARQYRMYQQYQQNYQNPYNQNPYNNNPYDNNQYNNNPYNNPPSDYPSSANQTEDPFADFGGSDSAGGSGNFNPFDDFDKN